jgi:hypothetical protein
LTITQAQVSRATAAALELEEFLGTRLDAVDYVILKLSGLRDEDGHPYRPDWMRGIGVGRILPRKTTEKYEHFVPSHRLSERELLERAAFVIDNMTGSWSIGIEGFNFEKFSDFFLYRLRFGEAA